MADLFVTEYTFSLAVTPANHSHTLAPEKAQAIPDTFGRIYDTISVQLDLFAVSSKTWRGMLLWDSMRFTKTYELWATQLRQDCLQRQKLGHLIREKDCSSWPTPQAFQNRGPLKTEFVDEKFVSYHGKERYGANIVDAVRVIEGKNWMTPRACDHNGQPDLDNPNTTGKSRGQLNPAWVEQLMNLPRGWTNFDFWATESSQIQQKKQSGICLRKQE